MNRKESAIKNLEKAHLFLNDPANKEQVVSTARKAGLASAAKRREMKQKIEAMEKALGKPILEK